MATAESKLISECDFACWCTARTGKTVCSQTFSTKFVVRRCDACGTHRILPRAISDHRDATVIYNDGREKVYYAKSEGAIRATIEKTVARMTAVDLRIGAGARVLEIGCSDGALIGNLHPELGLSRTGIDVDAKAIAAARLRYPEVDFMLGTFETLALENHSFDVVIASAIIEHVTDPVDFLNDIRRALKPTGRAFILTPNASSVTYKVLRSFWRELLAIGEHIYLFTPDSLGACARQAGLAIVGIASDYDSARVDWMALRFNGFRSAAISLFTVYIKGVKLLTKCFAGRTTGDILYASMVPESGSE